jgi:hypothetical protein
VAGDRVDAERGEAVEPEVLVRECLASLELRVAVEVVVDAADLRVGEVRAVVRRAGDDRGVRGVPGARL